MVNYYELLKLPEAITREEIELAFDLFKNELKKFSPGIQLSDTELRLRQPELWDAYVILLNPERRKEHDELLQRDRVHRLYESQIKKEDEENLKKSDKFKYIGLSGTVIVVIIFFLFRNTESSSLTEEPKWRTHYLTDEIQVILPGPADTNVNIIPPFLMNYIKNFSCCQSDLKGGFSVTTARFVMEDNFKISENDISYITNTEMGSHMAVHRTDSAKFTMNIRGYRVFVRKGTYVTEGILRAFENYSMLKGNIAIKIIVAYVPGDAKQIKFAETVFNSLTCYSSTSE